MHFRELCDPVYHVLSLPRFQDFIFATGHFLHLFKKIFFLEKTTQILSQFLNFFLSIFPILTAPEQLKICWLLIVDDCSGRLSLHLRLFHHPLQHIDLQRPGDQRNLQASGFCKSGILGKGDSKSLFYMKIY